MLSPQVSVLVPTYNGERYLRECLDSVIGQTDHNWELVIVDDCSTDRTFEIAQSYARRDPRVRLERNPRNLGLVRNWNRAATLARGQWMKFLFQDDIIAPRCLERMLTATSVGASIVSCRRDFLFDERTTDDVRRFYAEIPSIESVLGSASYLPAGRVCDMAIDHPGVNMIGEPTAVMLRNDVFSRFGSFNTDLIEIADSEYWIRVASHTGLHHVPDVLAQFRVHDESTTARNFASRKYRMHLDGVILAYEFAYSEAYAALREVAGSRTPTIDLTARLLDKARDARWTALEAARSGDDPTPLKEWSRLTQSYPRIDDLLLRNGGVLRDLPIESLRSALLAASEKIDELQRLTLDRKAKAAKLESELNWIKSRSAYRLLKTLQRFIARG